MRLVLGDKIYRQPMLDLLKLSIGEARMIKRHTGMTVADWRLGFATLNREDPDVFAALMYVFRVRAGEMVDWAEIDAVGAQDVIAGLQFSNDDRELMAQFLPPEVDWMSLVAPDERDGAAAADEPESAEPVRDAETVELPNQANASSPDAPPVSSTASVKHD